MKAIINGKIILKDRVVENMALLYSNVIEGVVTADQIPANAEIIDAKGGYVSPGLIDIHIHGYLSKDVCDGEKDSIRTIAGGIVKNGVTGFLPTTMTVDMKVIRKALEICRSLKEESSYLLVSLFLCLTCVVCVLVASLTLTCKCLHKIDFCFTVF